MSNILDDNYIDDLYKSYLEKIEKGEYLIPPLLTITEIVKSRYIDDNLDIVFNKASTCNIEKIDDFKNEEVFLQVVADNDTPEEVLDYKALYYYLSSKIISIDITVKYPNIVIVNSKNESHRIKDLFIKHTFNHEGQLTQKFQMNRSTYNYSELMCGYRHSHHSTFNINRNNLQRWNGTCLGQGTLSISVNALRRPNVDEFDEVAIMAYFADVDAYVAWESLEGVPYISLHNISNATTSGNNSMTYQRNANYSLTAYEKEVAKKLLENNYIIDNCKLVPSLYKNFPLYKLEYDEYKLVKYSTQVAESLNLFSRFKSNNKVCFAVVDDFGKVTYYTLSNSQNKIEQIKNVDNMFLFKFKNQDVKLKAIDDVQKIEEKRELVIQPCIIYYIISNLENEINKRNGRNKFHQSAL